MDGGDHRDLLAVVARQSDGLWRCGPGRREEKPVEPMGGWEGGGGVGRGEGIGRLSGRSSCGIPPHDDLAYGGRNAPKWREGV